MSWLKRGVEALADPDRAKRFEFYTTSLQQELARKKQNFSLAVALHQLQVPYKETNDVIEEAYKRILNKRWEDEQITAEERSVLDFVVAKLQIPAQRAAQLNHELGLALFQKAFVESMADGVVDAREHARLTNIAAGMNTTVPQLVRSYFRDEAGGLLRALFDAVTVNGVLLEQEWRHLLQTATYLGVSIDELASEIAPQARAFVESVLADA